MNAIHVNSTAPYFSRHAGVAYGVEKFSLYNTVVSALQWRKENGSIRMITDSVAAEYYKRLGIESVWDEVLTLIPDDLEGIDPDMFWAAGKLIALRDIPENAALIDEDFVVWKKLTLPDDAVTAAHVEYLNPDIYPDPRLFAVRGFPLLDRLDMTALPLNTAFLYIPDESLRLFYANQAIAFMKAASLAPCDDRLCRMVFAEQRLLGMICAYTDTKVSTLLKADRLFVAQDDYTHLWGAKQAMRDNEERREQFINRCRERIRSDFPDYAFVIDAIEENAK